MVPKPGQRAFIVGKTGSGKSTLARSIVSIVGESQPVIILDPKGEFDPPFDCSLWDGKSVVTGRNIIFRPDVFGATTEAYDVLFNAAWKKTNVAVYIDELYALERDNKYPELLRSIYTMGRSKKITVIAATQRPVFVPNYCISESEWFYFFRMNLASDQQKLAPMVGQESVEYPLDKFNFFIRCVDPTESVPESPLKLTLHDRAQ